MFCPKCGQQNPDIGKFCRGCGTDLGNVSSALSAPPAPVRLTSRKGRPIYLETAITKMFTGLAFLIIAIILGVTGLADAKLWWFWLLIPAFGSLGRGIAQYVQIRQAEKGKLAGVHVAEDHAFPPIQNSALPSKEPEWVSPESKYRTGDLVPPSVTEHTTRHLDINSEGETIALPKK
jgi:hypothetical protein